MLPAQISAGGRQRVESIKNIEDLSPERCVTSMTDGHQEADQRCKSGRP
jgi:hypothetical protein